MSRGAKIITFTGTSNKNLFDMTIDTEDGRTLVLMMARFESTYTGTSWPRVVNVQIGNTVSTDHVIDNDPGYNYFKIILDQKEIAGAPNKNISVTYPQTSYTMSGRINKITDFNLFDENHAPFPDLTYFCLQFQLI